jgi:hypothetical protein
MRAIKVYFLEQNGLDSISAQERYRALQVFDHLEQIAAWRDGLRKGKRLKLNHPGACWHAWKRSTAIVEPAPRREPVIRPKGHARCCGGRPKPSKTPARLT